MIVVDTNIISYLFLNSEYSELAEKSYQKDPHWTAPFLWRSEFRNVLALYLRKEILTLNDAVQIMNQAELLMKDNEYTLLSSDILELALQSNCSAYDCEFISLAKELNIPMITMDHKILKTFPKIAVKPDKFIIT